MMTEGKATVTVTITRYNEGEDTPYSVTQETQTIYLNPGKLRRFWEYLKRTLKNG